MVSITSMEPKARHVRDTKPRVASGNNAPVIVDVDALSANGHEDGSNNGQVPTEEQEES